MRSHWRIVILLLLVMTLVGCEKPLLDPARPVSLTFWHVYGSVADSPMNDLITRFNQTVGREKGIIINVTSMFTTTSIHESLVATARARPGAGPAPDMFMVYPRDVLAIGPERLLDWRSRISPDRLGEYVPAFLDEGTLDGRLLILPIAKSTSALFVNDTIFEEFSRDTGIDYASLATWEGLFKAAAVYYQWSGGKAFLKHDDWIHYFLLNTAALGGTFLKDGVIDQNDQHFQKLWNMLAKAAVAGHICLMDGYATTAMMTGEALCGIESSASILYYKDCMTFPDNTRKPLRLRILPVPYFKDTSPLAIQRGSGLAVYAGDARKELAASIFAEWLTETEVNIPFVVQTGYLPVKSIAYEQFLEKKQIPANTEREKELYGAVSEIYQKSDFYIPPYFPGYGEVEKKFRSVLRKIFQKYRKSYKMTQTDDTIADTMLAEFMANMD